MNLLYCPCCEQILEPGDPDLEVYQVSGVTWYSHIHKEGNCVHPYICTEVIHPWTNFIHLQCKERKEYKDRFYKTKDLLRKFRDQYERQRRPLSLDGHWKLSDAIKETLKEIKEVLGEKDDPQEEDMVTVVETPMQVYESDLSGIKTVTLTAKPLSFLCKPSWVLQDELTEAMRDPLCRAAVKEMGWELTATPEQRKIRSLEADVGRLEREVLSLKRKIKYHEEVEKIRLEFMCLIGKQAETSRQKVENLWNDSEYARELEERMDNCDESLDDALEDES